MGAAYALVLLLCALSPGAHAEYDDLILPVPAQTAQQPHRHLLQTAEGTYGGYGYGYQGYGGYGGYGYGESLEGGARRHLMQSGGYGYGYGGYGYGSYGVYGYGRRLAEIDFGLQPRDELLEYAEQQEEQREQRLEKLQDAANGLSAAAVAALQQAHSSKRTSLSVPAGQCYCRYDVDFNVWALAEDSCKQALYQRCKTEAGLPCDWLDKLYAPAAGPAHNLPHEKDIAAFLHEDCSPQPPCACTGLKFDGSDPVATAVGCCRDLRVACKTPFSGLCCKKVAAFCSDDQPIPMLAAWTAHNLHHADCSSYAGVPFKFVPYKDMQAAAAAKAMKLQEDTAEEQLLKQALNSMGAQQAVPAGAGAGRVYGIDPRTWVAVSAGAVCVAIVAVLFAMARHTEDHSNTLESDFLEADEEYFNETNLNSNVNLNDCPTAGKGMSCECEGVLSGAENGHLARVVSVSTLSTGSGGVREPLLHSQSSNTVNRTAPSGSGLYSNASGNYLPRSGSQVSLADTQS